METKNLNEVIKELNIRSIQRPIDEILVKDAFLCFSNEVEFYNSHFLPCALNLQKKFEKGIFDFTLACKLFANAIQQYQKKELHTSHYCGVKIEKLDRIGIAHNFVEHILDELKLGNRWNKR